MPMTDIVAVDAAWNQFFIDRDGRAQGVSRPCEINGVPATEGAINAGEYVLDPSSVEFIRVTGGVAVFQRMPSRDNCFETQEQLTVNPGTGAVLRPGKIQLTVPDGEVLTYQCLYDDPARENQGERALTYVLQHCVIVVTC